MSTIDVTGDYVIGPAEHLVFDASASPAYTLLEPADGTSSKFTEEGYLEVSSSAGGARLVAIQDGGHTSGVYAIKIASGGNLIVNATASDSSAFGCEDQSDSFQNDGMMAVSAGYYARGVSFGDGAPASFTNSGTFRVSARTATGVSSLGPIGFINTGDFEVSGLNPIGVAVVVAAPGDVIENDGQIHVSATPGGHSIGIMISSTIDGVPLEINNTRTITAEYAVITEYNNYYIAPPVILNNSGVINGGIFLGAPYADINRAGSQIHNTGALNGAIHLDNGTALYDGGLGTQSGGIYLGVGANKVILGNDGETVYAAGGDPDIIGGLGLDTVVPGGKAADYSVTQSGGVTTVVGPRGIDTLTNVELLQFSDEQMIISPAGQSLVARAGGDTLMGGEGNDTLFSGPGDDVLNGGPGSNTVSYAAATSAVTVSLAVTKAQNTHGAGTDTFSHIQNLIGSAHNDVLTGDGNNNILSGGGGNDTLNGGAGDDLLDGGAGNDVLNGGPGVDTASYADATSGVAVSLLLTGPQNTGGAGTDTLVSIENLIGSPFDDTLAAANTGSSLRGMGGNDVLVSGAGDDTLDGGAGTNSVSYARATAAVTVSLALEGSAQNTHGAGSDTLIAIENLIGSKFNDTLTGDSNANLITGGAGRDTMTGGGGADTFVFTAITDSKVAAPDLITDFTSGQDRIDLSAIDANTALPGDQAFHLGATAKHAGDIVVHFDAAHNRTVIDLYVNADSKADAEIWLTGNHALTAADFVL